MRFRLGLAGVALVAAILVSLDRPVVSFDRAMVTKIVHSEPCGVASVEVDGPGASTKRGKKRECVVCVCV